MNTLMLCLCILATSVEVERVFSRGRLVLSHVRNRLTAQSTRASLCVGDWSGHGWIKDSDVLEETIKDDLSGPELPLAKGWDAIPTA